MRKFQRTIAAIAAVATAISAMSIASFAEGEETPTTNEGQSSLSGTAVEGDGSFEGTVEKVKYNIILPTQPAETTTMYDFILDPQGLIAATSATKYSGATFEADKYLFFKNLDGNYTDASDALTAYNLSTEDVKLTVTGTITDAGDVGFVDATAGFTENATRPEIQLAIIDGEETASKAQYFATANGATTATYTADIDGLDDAKFAITYNTSKAKYEWDYNTTTASAIEAVTDGNYASINPGASFKLIGAIANDSTGEVWENYTATPKVSVVWSMADPNASAAPSVTLTDNEVEANETALVIPFDLGKGAAAAESVSSIAYTLPSGGTGTFRSGFTIDNNAITFDSAKSGVLTAGSTLTITFNTGDAITVTVVDAE